MGGHGLNSMCRCSITCSKTVGAVRVVCFCKDGETEIVLLLSLLMLSLMSLLVLFMFSLNLVITQNY